MCFIDAIHSIFHCYQKYKQLSTYIDTIETLNTCNSIYVYLHFNRNDILEL